MDNPSKAVHLLSLCLHKGKKDNTFTQTSVIEIMMIVLVRLFLCIEIDVCTARPQIDVRMQQAGFTTFPWTAHKCDCEQEDARQTRQQRNALADEATSCAGMKCTVLLLSCLPIQHSTCMQRKQS